MQTKKLYLRTLDLSNNMVTRVGGRPLMESMGSNDSIENLYLTNNLLGDETAQELIESLKGSIGNKKLRKVFLQHNSINIRYIEEIQVFLNRNEMVAMERVLPDYRREIISMRNDRKELHETGMDIINAGVSMKALDLRNKKTEEEFQGIMEREDYKYEQLRKEMERLITRKYELDALENDTENRFSSKTLKFAAKEKEYLAFIAHVKKDEETIENEK